MDPGITDIATYLATRIPTGSDTPEGAVREWRETLYNARATNCLRPLQDMVIRAVPRDEQARALVEGLIRRRS
jgi:hypothetical protein